MPKGSWITADIYGRLRERLGLSEQQLSAQDMAFLGMVLGITNIDELRRTLKIATKTVDLSGAGMITVFTVPTGKRWRLLHIVASGTVVGSYTDIYDGSASITIQGASASTKTGLTGGVPLPLDEGWTIRRASTGDAGDASESTQILYEEEDAY